MDHLMSENTNDYQNIREITVVTNLKWEIEIIK